MKRRLLGGDGGRPFQVAQHFTPAPSLLREAKLCEGRTLVFCSWGTLGASRTPLLTDFAMEVSPARGELAVGDALS